MKYLTDYIPASSSDGYVVIEEDGVLKAQKLTFDGTTATPSGEAETITDTGLFPTGMDEPAYNGGGGGSCKYYKCASVDTTTQTWSGYELVLTDGVYSVSETLTTGLSYAGFIPEQNMIYNSDTTVRIGRYYNPDLIPDDYVFYAPLSAASDTAETGQTLTTDGSITYQTFNGIACAYFNGSGTRIYSSSFSTISGSQPSTMSFWVYVTGKGGSNWDAMFMMFGTWSNSRAVATLSYSAEHCKRIRAQAQDGESVDYVPSSESILDKWYHVTYVVDESYEYLYINGDLVGTSTNNSIDTISDGYPVVMGGSERDVSDRNLIGYLAGCRIYNRALTQEEITALASEFTPTE